MADTIGSALPANAAPTTDDKIILVNDPGGSPELQNATITALITTIAANLPADAIDAITEIAAALKTGADAKLVTGTAGSDTDLAQWNADSDVVGISLASLAGSTTVAGFLEAAIASEVNTGTDTVRAVTPDAFAGSNFGISYLQVVVFEYTANTAVGNGAGYAHIPPALNGMNLVYVHAKVITAGTTGTTDIQIANDTQAADMLTTKLTIDSAETGSDTAATAAVIDAANDDVATNDLIRIDIDAVSSTAAKGLIVTLGFQLP